MNTTAAYQCSQCGQKGHNKRTCATTNRTAVPFGKNKTPQKSRKTHTKVVGEQQLTSRNIITMWDSYIANKENEKECANDQLHTAEESSSPKVEPYSEVELETLWMLTSDKDGKRKKGEGKYDRWGRNTIWDENSTHQLVEMVQEACKVSPETTTAAWNKFFKNFGTEAKTKFLDAHAKTLQTRNAEKINILDFSDKNSETLEEKPELPVKLFPIFAKDTSPVVRQTLAKMVNMPPEVATILSEDKRAEVVVALSGNPHVETETLDRIVERFGDGDKRDGFHVTPGNWYIHKRRLHTGIENIISHPNVTHKIINNYLNNPTLMKTSGTRLEEMIYANPKTPKDIIHTRYYEYKKKINKLNTALETAKGELEKCERNLISIDAYNAANNKVTEVEKEKRNVEQKLNVMVKGGHCSPEITKTEIRRMYENGGGWTTHRALAETLARATLTSEDMTEQYLRAKNPKNDICMLGVLRNKNTPKEVFEDHIKTVQEECGVGVDPKTRLGHYEIKAYELALERLTKNT